MRLTSTLTLSLFAACTPISLDPFDSGDDAGTSGDGSDGADEPTTAASDDETTDEPGGTDTGAPATDTTGGPLTVDCDESFTVPDPQLMADLRTFLGLAADQPIPLALAQTTTSVAIRLGVEDLDGLQCFSGLTLLVFEPEVQVEDLGPLSGLQQLQYLDLSLSAVDDLSPLAGLPELSFLGVAGTGVSDLGALASTPKLGKLDIGHTPVTSLAPLAGHPSLVELRATALTGKLDPSGLASLPKLAELHLDENPLDSLDFLIGAPSLRILSAMQTGVKDVSPLAGLTTLVDLRLSVNAITDVSPLVALPQLESLGVDQNPLVGGLAPLAGAPALRILSADGCGLTEVPTLGATPLEMLFLGNNGITDVTPLLAYPDLLRVSVAGNKVTSLAPLADPPWSFLQIDVQKNLLDDESIGVIVPTLCDAGFRMLWGDGEGCNID